MPLWLDICTWLVRISAVALFVLTALPFVHTGNWVVRMCDFPRVQLATTALIFLGFALILALLTAWRREPWFWASLLTLLVGWQFAYIVPFTPLWPRKIASTDAPNLSLVIANLDFRNPEHTAAADRLRELNADMLLLIEIDDRWAQELADLRSSYRHHVEAIRGEGLGIALWSRVELTDTDVQFLVTERRPSLVATMHLEDGIEVRFIGLHPTPPGLPIRGADGRHDSRIRDAELLLAADRVTASPHSAWIVAGDFNDVAWSDTTAMFAKESGLMDPRIGRSLLNTFHSEYPPLRYPLDHIFVSPHMEIGRFERVKVPGSDHFAVHAELRCPSIPHGPEPDKEAVDEETEQEVIREGIEDAQENEEKRQEKSSAGSESKAEPR